LFNSHPRVVIASLSLALTLIGLGCESGARVGSRATLAATDVSGLLPYDGPTRTLFDDSVDAEVFPGAAEGQTGALDQRLSNLVRLSTLVVPVTVVTVTGESGSSAGRMELELIPVERPTLGSLAPNFQSGEPIRVLLRSGTSGFALVVAHQNEIVGKRMNLCWGRFSEGSEAVEHWHALSDSAKTRLAIAQAAALVNLD
jgi:hypothetical protein